MAKSETRYRQLFETSCDGIVMLDAHGRFNDCNRAYLGLLGYESVDEIRGKSIFDITPSEYHPLDLRVLREDLPVRGYSDEYEKEYYRKDGSRIPVVVRAWLTPGESGPRAIVRDLSPLRMMEENSSAMEKYRILGESAAAISHEVRNPLTTVRGFLQHFSSKPIYSDDDKEFFELMIKELDSATTIISDFLDTARPSRLKLQEFDLAAVVASLCRVMESRALLQKVDMATDTAGPMMVCGDAGQIRQVLINLLQNALQAMPAGGSLTVRCSVEDSMARVEIADTGVGIPFENLEKIGRPFFTTKPGGSGLGLSTCYRIIGTHRGRIAVESEIGKGTTFTCYLPLA
ncbi:MAG: two-component system sensor histidine kinase NtrB [Bacillota bacterium]